MLLILCFHNLIWVLEAVDVMDNPLHLLPKRVKRRVNIHVYYIKPFHFTLFHFKPMLEVWDWVEWCRHTSQIALVSSTQRTLLILGSPNHQINSLCFSQTSSSGPDFDVTPWSERRMRESSFLLSKRSMATLTKPHCPSNPPEQAFSSSETSLVAHKTFLFWAKLEFCHYLHALVSFRTRMMLFLPMNTTWGWKILFLMSSLSFFFFS